jgi:hypothetical protein
VIAVDANPTQQHRKALAERLDLSEEQVQVRFARVRCWLGSRVECSSMQ